VVKPNNLRIAVLTILLLARGICPLLNALANHGYLPRTGRQITENQTVTALHDALNIDNSLGAFLFTAGQASNPKPNATTFDLDNLDRHNLFEHDGSLRYAQPIPA
jgi:hypothetical protein